MKVFISWSGDRSRKLAEFLAGWLKKLPLAIEPWVSKDAIDPGVRWGKELSEALEGTSFGILCITAENQREPWISFEAGALSKTIEKSYVVPYLIGMKPPELEQPLKQFQAIEANEEDTWKLIETIHMVSEDKTRTVNDLKDTFNVWWPKLSEQIENIKAIEIIENEEPKMPTTSDIQNSLGKVLTLLESLSSRFTKLETERFNPPQYGLLNYVTDLRNKATGLGMIDYLNDQDKNELINRLHNLSVVRDKKAILGRQVDCNKKEPDDK